jgi:integration host factor subunit alpha
MTLKKAQLIESFSNRTGMSKVQSKRTIDDLCGILKETLVNGEDVLMSGFGKFCVQGITNIRA